MYNATKPRTTGRWKPYEQKHDLEALVINSQSYIPRTTGRWKPYEQKHDLEALVINSQSYITYRVYLLRMTRKKIPTTAHILFY